MYSEPRYDCEMTRRTRKHFENFYAIEEKDVFPV